MAQVVFSDKNAPPDAVVWKGKVNVTQDVILANIRSAIRRGWPQAQPHQPHGQMIALVGGGPSLEHTFEELRAQVLEGSVKIAAVNGAYRWLLERNIRPHLMIIMDARPFNARFVEPAVPGCRYLAASQCAPETLDALEGRDVTLWHAISDDPEERATIDDYYFKAWHVPMGGTTVMLRAIGLLRMLGVLRLHIYGMDSCWMGDAHHAYDQEENARDRAMPIWSIPTHPSTGEPLHDRKRLFYCDPWHMKQAQEFQQLLQVYDGLMQVHGDGLIAHMVRTAAALAPLVSEEVSADGALTT